MRERTMQALRWLLLTFDRLVGTELPLSFLVPSGTRAPAVDDKATNRRPLK